MSPELKFVILATIKFAGAGIIGFFLPDFFKENKIRAILITLALFLLLIGEF